MTHIKGFFENDTESRRKFSDLTGTIIVYVLTPTVHIYNYQRSQLLPPAVKCSLSRRRLSSVPFLASCAGPESWAQGWCRRSAVTSSGCLDSGSESSLFCLGPQFPHLWNEVNNSVFCRKDERVSPELTIGLCICSLSSFLYFLKA